ncbi:MAG: AMP-binding protein [Myxococcales bacterium]|nr:AMP-binding protein [Myxococcales bacterium]
MNPETGEDCSVNEDGEVWIRGPQVMKGYLNNLAATEDCIDADGFFHTGDIGHVDEDGHYLAQDHWRTRRDSNARLLPPEPMHEQLFPAFSSVG